MIFYAIRKKDTDEFLPEVRKGRSHTEPTAGVPPRLFKDARSAKIALSYWLMGRWRVSHYDHWSGEGGELEPCKVEGRKREDMEVVPVSLGVVL